MSQQVFCGRPGCGLAKSAHGFAPDACSNFIGKGSKEARALEPTKVESSPVDSSLLDRMLMEHTILDLESRRKQAIHATQACLAAAKAGAPRTASRYAERALKALGGLGAS